jgi:hypothetical protein
MIKYYDNIFDANWIAETASVLVKQPWFADNIANRHTWPYKDTGSHRILGSTYFWRHSDIDIVYNENRNLSFDFINAFEHIQSVCQKKIYLHEIMANLQFKGMDGTAHRDGDKGHYAFILLLCNEALPNKIGGEFIHLPSKKKIPFVNGRLIEINAEDPHHAMSFNKPNYARMSLKWMGRQIF